MPGLFFCLSFRFLAKSLPSPHPLSRRRERGWGEGKLLPLPLLLLKLKLKLKPYPNDRAVLMMFTPSKRVVAEPCDTADTCPG